MKRYLFLLVSLTVLLACVLPCFNDAKATGYSDDTFEYTILSDGNLAITGYTGGGGPIVIPTSYDPGGGSIDVTAIGNSVFANRSNITSVYIPAGITSIGSYAFYNCGGINTVTFENGAKEIGLAMFAYCSALNSVTIPASIVKIKQGAFLECGSLSNIALPEGLEELGHQVFSKSGLTSVTLPSTITTVGDLVFEDCSSLESVTFANGSTVIGQRMFYNCDALNSIVIPSSITTIFSSAFYGCDGLKSATFQEGLTVIGQEMFDSCSKLDTLEIPTSVTSIGHSAFSNCGSLTSVTIPASVLSFGDGVFRNCDGLSSITMSDGLAYIGRYMFEDCDSISTVIFPASISLIRDEAFRDCSSLVCAAVLNEAAEFESSIFDGSKMSTDGVIYGFNDSTAEEYANGNEITFREFQTPSIASQPSDKTAVLNETATFSVVASGIFSLTYQWQINRGNGWINISGEDKSTYTTSPVSQSNDGYRYRVVVSDLVGSTISDTAILHYVQSADIPITSDNARPGLLLGLGTTSFAILAVIIRMKYVRVNKRHMRYR